MPKLCRFTILCAGLLFALGCELVEPESKAARKQRDENFDFSTVSWLGPAYPDTQRDKNAILHSASMDREANVLTLSYDPLPEDWPSEGNALGQLVMFEELDDDRWRGGRVAWLDADQTEISLDDIDRAWPLPPSGTRIAIVILSTDGQFCTNAVFSDD